MRRTIIKKKIPIKVENPFEWQHKLKKTTKYNLERTSGETIEIQYDFSVPLLSDFEYLKSNITHKCL